MRTIDSTLDIVSTMAKTIERWQTEIQGFSEISLDSAAIFDNLEKQLPIRVPIVKINTKHIKFNLPEIIPKTRPIVLKYPASTTVRTDTKPFKIPTGITVKTKDYSTKIFGKKIGFSYPSDIRTNYKDVSFEYPSKLEVKHNAIKLNVPTSPKIKMKDYSFDVPDKLAFTHRELMKAEKKLLKKTSSRLKSTSRALLDTQKMLHDVRGLLSNETVKSLKATKSNIEIAEQSLNKLHEKRIADVVKRLSDQKRELNKSKDIFSVIEGLLPLSAVIVGLVLLSIIISGIGKLVLTRDANKDYSKGYFSNRR
jgi:hypothetical protein